MTPTAAVKGYELREQIGAGGFGSVYRAYQSSIGREVAIKIILPGLANQADFIRRFENEAQLVARLEHPHVTPLYDYWRDPDGAYLVMRWLRGGSLRDALKSGKFTLHSAALLLDQIAGALSVAHRSNIIHRDVKPGNILLDEDSNAYLTDFGIAKDLTLAGGHTHPDAIIGSLDYISPEQARSEPITARTDIYSLGVTLYEVITGRHPFAEVTSVERLYKHINDPLPEVSDIGTPDVTTAVNRVIQRATAKNPQHRYPDALAFAADFREAIGLDRTSTSVVELLTQREHEILHLIIEGLSNKEIAQRLTVTLSTVKWYINQIYTKLGVRSRVQAQVRARELNLLVKADERVSAETVATQNFFPPNPYKGLQPFQSADYQAFFGRERATARLVERLGESGEYARFLALVGPSGSGKSSLVKAGLIPALWRGALPGSEKWFVVEMLPGSRPLDALEIALTKVAANQSATLRQQLERDAHGLVRIADLILPNDNSDLMLIVDQFEELFTLVVDEAERRHFLALLVAAVTTPRTRVRVITTLRADFYDRPLHYPDFAQLLYKRLETILPLSADELEHAISKPAAQSGMTFEAGLVSSIVADVNYQPGALPLLQYALTELFDRRQGRILTREAYGEIGGAVGALAKRAEQIYGEMTPDNQQITRQMFLRLVTLGEGVEDTRRRISRAELLSLVEDDDAVDELIDTFAGYRLLALDNDGVSRTPTVELAHEAILREWKQFRQWIGENREDIKMQQQLSHLTEEWLNAGKDSSYLVQGLRLEQFEKWSKEARLALTPDERSYLNTSIARREQERETETQRKERELALERRSRTFLRGLVAVLMLATVIALFLSLTAVNNANQAQAERDTAQIERERAEAQTLIAEQERQRAEEQSLISQGRELVGYATANLNSDAELSTLLALKAVDIITSVNGTVLPEANTVLHQAVQGMRASSTQIPSAVFPSGWIFNFMFSEDGTKIIYPTEANESSGALGVTGITDIATGELLLTIPGDLALETAIGNRLLTLGGTDEALEIVQWDISSGESAEIVSSVAVPYDNSVEWRNYSSDLHYAVYVTERGRTTEIWDLTTGEQVVTPATEALSTGINGKPLFSFDASMLANLNADGTISILETATWTEITRLALPDVPISAFNFGPDSQTVVTASSDNWVSVWDPRTGEEVYYFPVTDLPELTAISNGGTRIAVKSSTNLVTVMDAQTDRVVTEFTAPRSAWMMFSPDGNVLATNEYSGTVTLWHLDESFGVLTMDNGVPDLDLGPLGVAYSPDGMRVVAASVLETPIVWDAQTGQQVMTLVGHSDRVLTVAWSANGDYIASAGNDADVIVWDAETGASLLTLSGHEDGIYAVAFSPDSARVASSSYDGTVRVWDAVTGELQLTLSTPEANKGLAWSPDGTRIAAGTNIADDGSHVLIWDAVTGEVQLDILVGNIRMGALAFSPDGTRILGGTLEAHAAKVWDAQTGEELLSLNFHTDLVGGVAYSPDGATIATGSHDGTIRLWDGASGAPLLTLNGAPEGIPRLAFSPDGTRLATANEDGTTRIYIVALDEMIATAESRLTRTFTDAECQLYLHTDTCPS